MSNPDGTVDGIVWEEPKSDGRSKWAQIFSVLRENPGRWAVVHTGTPSNCGTVASHIKAGRYGGARRGEFDAVSRSDGDVSKTYARYVGGEA